MKSLSIIIPVSIAMPLAMGLATGCAVSDSAGEVTSTAATRSPDPLLPGLGNDGYDARAYDLNFDVGAKSRTVDGTATMTAQAHKPLARFGMDFAGGTVHSVSVDARPARFQAKGQKLVVVPARGLDRGLFRVTVRYTADRDAKVPSTVDPSAGWGDTGGGGFAWWGQPDRAHLFFPCNDDLTDKAIFRYRVTVPNGWTAIANGTQTSRSIKADRTTMVYSSQHPMATQLAQLAVGRFKIVQGQGPHGLPLRSAVPAGSTIANLQRLPEYLTWLENKIGRRYPFEAAGVLGVSGSPPEQTFALETQTLPIFTASDLSDSQEIVHELAHQWFGDSAGVKTWSDLWLSEGFASYLDQMWAAEHGGTPLDTAMRKAYQGDQKIRSMGITPARPRRADAMFGVSRGVGPLVLYALRQKVGDAGFQQIVGTYFDRYRDRSASTADFMAVAHRVAGPQMDDFLHDWLYESKTPPMPGHPDW
ncbi:M1 family metallopeptidase [Actinoallomurus sp. NBC_01490]|uniref:M1 family metallopeptidase n=1 Tax=Actinoallomurus sp. NBC_01490 TaxID=2903557 RepID=UPI002E2EF005|nr:M1 family metallopeptidase [Actinoallomurus sp. NBC_01490]